MQGSASGTTEVVQRVCIGMERTICAVMTTVVKQKGATMNVWNKNRRRRRKLRQKTKNAENVSIHTITYAVSNFKVFNTYEEALAEALKG